MSIATRRGTEASRARREAETLAHLAARFGDDDPFRELTELLRTTFGLDSVTLLRDSAPDT